MRCVYVTVLCHCWEQFWEGFFSWLLNILVLTRLMKLLNCASWSYTVKGKLVWWLLSKRGLERDWDWDRNDVQHPNMKSHQNQSLSLLSCWAMLIFIDYYYFYYFKWDIYISVGISIKHCINCIAKSSLDYFQIPVQFWPLSLQWNPRKAELVLRGYWMLYHHEVGGTSTAFPLPNQ